MVRTLIEDLSILSKRTPEIDLNKTKSKEISKIVDDMCDTLNTFEDRLFLCGNEIGINYRVIAVKFKDETDVFFNPSISSKDKMILFRERSVVDKKEYIIPRFTDMSIAFQDYKGNVKGYKLNEGLAMIFGQALDLLNGVFDSDYGLEILPEFDEANDSERSELLAYYMDNLKNTYAIMDSELSSDSETASTWRTAKFVTAVARGDIKLEKEEPKLSHRKEKKLKKLLKQWKKVI